MTSQTGQQIIIIHIWHNILKSKDNQTMKFVQLIKYIAINIFFRNHPDNDAESLVPDLFLLNKLRIRSEQVVSTLFLIYFGRPQLGHTINVNFTTFQAVDPKMSQF